MTVSRVDMFCGPTVQASAYIEKTYFACHTLWNDPITSYQCIRYCCFTYKAWFINEMKYGLIQRKQKHSNFTWIFQLLKLTVVNMGQNTNIPDIFWIFLELRKMLRSGGSHGVVYYANQRKYYLIFTAIQTILLSTLPCCGAILSPQARSGCLHWAWVNKSFPILRPRNVHCHSLKNGG